MDDWSRRVALAQRLMMAERELQRAVAKRDGSPAARTRYSWALVDYWLAEAAGRAELGVAGADLVGLENSGGAGLVA